MIDISTLLSKSSLQLELERGKLQVERRYFTVQLEATMICFGFVKSRTNMHLKMVVLSTGTFMKHKDDTCAGAPFGSELTSLLLQVCHLYYTFCFWPALNVIGMEACSFTGIGGGWAVD